MAHEEQISSSSRVSRISCGVRPRFLRLSRVYEGLVEGSRARKRRLVARSAALPHTETGGLAWGFRRVADPQASSTLARHRFQAR